ncbi:ribonuclease U2 [Gyrodon lividus]|nr:ribonuclease U2 [Gyrodon lividus]
MVSLNTLLCLALVAVPTFAAPSALQARDTTWTCSNSQGTIKISQNAAESNIHAAPLTDGTTKSSYPHKFQNVGGYNWPNSKCNFKATSTNFLLEFPVFADGHLYPFDVKPKADPGPARAIFTYPSKDFCGVIAHTEANQGPLVLCSA